MEKGCRIEIKITSKEFIIEKGSQKIALLLCRFVW